MHDFILSSIEREGDASEHQTFEPVPRPKFVTFSTERSNVFCPWCGDIVDIVSVTEAAEAFNTDVQDIRFLLNAGEIHALRQDAVVAAVCRSSLEDCFERRRTRLLDSHFEYAIEQSISDREL